jgi:hypothetical protein
MARIVSTREQIEGELRLGLVPAVDNVAILQEMGFEQLYPHVRDGYHEQLWGRQVDLDDREGLNGVKRRAIQRAVLDPQPEKTAA